MSNLGRTGQGTVLILLQIQSFKRSLTPPTFTNTPDVFSPRSFHLSVRAFWRKAVKWIFKCVCVFIFFLKQLQTFFSHVFETGAQIIPQNPNEMWKVMCAGRWGAWERSWIQASRCHARTTAVHAGLGDSIAPEVSLQTNEQRSDRPRAQWKPEGSDPL